MSNGRKDDSFKLRYDLIPPQATEELAKVLTFGAKKYDENNWQNVESDRYVAALYRHLNAWQQGEKNDPESNFHHLSHALCNITFLLWKELNKKKKPIIEKYTPPNIQIADPYIRQGKIDEYIKEVLQKEDLKTILDGGKK